MATDAGSDGFETKIRDLVLNSRWILFCKIQKMKMDTVVLLSIRRADKTEVTKMFQRGCDPLSLFSTSVVSRYIIYKLSPIPSFRCHVLLQNFSTVFSGGLSLYILYSTRNALYEFSNRCTLFRGRETAFLSNEHKSSLFGVIKKSWTKLHCQFSVVLLPFVLR